MNLVSIISAIGVGDGEGNVSSGRVAFLLIIAAVLLPKCIVAVQTKSAPQWDQQDAMLLTIAFGGKLAQNHQESKTEAPKTP